MTSMESPNMRTYVACLACVSAVIISMDSSCTLHGGAVWTQCPHTSFVKSTVFHIIVAHCVIMLHIHYSIIYVILVEIAMDHSLVMVICK